MSALQPAFTFKGMRAAQQGYNLSPFQFAAYMAIVLHADGRTGKTPPISYTELGEKAGMGRRTAVDSAKALKAAGLIAIESGKEDKERNRYSLLMTGAAFALAPTVPSAADAPASAADAPEDDELVQDLHSASAADAHNKDSSGGLNTNGLNDRAETGVGVVVDEQETDAGEDLFEEETATEPARPTLFAIYAEEIGKLTQMVGEELADLVKEHGEDGVTDAIRAAVTANVRTLAYIKGVLRRKAATAKNDFRGQDSHQPRIIEKSEPVDWSPPDAKNDFRVVHEAPAGPEADAWSTAYRQLELQLEAGKFETWVRDTRFLRVEDGRFVIGVKNGFTRDMLQHRLYRNLRTVVSQAWGQDVELIFEIVPGGQAIDSDIPLYAVRQPVPARAVGD